MNTPFSSRPPKVVVVVVSTSKEKDHFAIAIALVAVVVVYVVLFFSVSLKRSRLSPFMFTPSLGKERLYIFLDFFFVSKSVKVFSRRRFFGPFSHNTHKKVLISLSSSSALCFVCLLARTTPDRGGRSPPKVGDEFYVVGGLSSFLSSWSWCCFPLRIDLELVDWK